MPELMIVTKSPGAWASFAAVLAARTGSSLGWVQGREAALARLRQGPVELAVVDTGGDDAAAQALVRDMLMVSALTNNAVVSGLPADEFHEAYEGLGVLAQLPPRPGRAQALELADRLAALKP